MIAIIDSGGANITSVQLAFERLGVTTQLTRDPTAIQNAEKVILPGVGAAPEAMRKLKNYGLVDTIKSLTQPVLGICLGMQLLFSTSEEGGVNLLNLISAPITRFNDTPNRSVPHMGWNTVQCVDHPLTQNLNNAYFYFVHSYKAPCNSYTLGTCTYDENFSAIVAHNNFMGVQFHPERSSKAGAQLLANFIGLKP